MDKTIFFKIRDSFLLKLYFAPWRRDIQTASCTHNVCASSCRLDACLSSWPCDVSLISCTCLIEVMIKLDAWRHFSVINIKTTSYKCRLTSCYQQLILILEWEIFQLSKYRRTRLCFDKDSIMTRNRFRLHCWVNPKSFVGPNNKALCLHCNENVDPVHYVINCPA